MKDQKNTKENKPVKASKDSKDSSDKKVKDVSEKKVKALSAIDDMFSKAQEKKTIKKLEEKEKLKQERKMAESSSSSSKKSSSKSSSSSSSHKRSSGKKFKVIKEGFEAVQSEDEGDFVWDSDEGLLQPVDSDVASEDEVEGLEDLGGGRVYGMIQNKYSKGKIINPEAPLERIDPESGMFQNNIT